MRMNRKTVATLAALATSGLGGCAILDEAVQSGALYEALGGAGVVGPDLTPSTPADWAPGGRMGVPTPQTRYAASVPSTPSPPTSAPRTASKSLIFLLQMDAGKVVQEADGSWNNARCHSNVVNIVGPPGWGTPDWGRNSADGPALDQVLRPYIVSFEAACAAYGGTNLGRGQAYTNQGGNDPIAVYNSYRPRNSEFRIPL